MRRGARYPGERTRRTPRWAVQKTQDTHTDSKEESLLSGDWSPCLISDAASPTHCALVHPQMNLTIAVHNIGSFSLLSQLEMSLRTIQDKMGLSEEDLDEVKARKNFRHTPSSARLRWHRQPRQLLGCAVPNTSH